MEEIAAGEWVRVESVFERDRGLLEYLDGLGIRPGVRLRMVAGNCDDTFTLSVNRSTVQLGRAAAAKMWVTPAS